VINLERTPSPYLKWMLSRNPFSELSSESLEDVGKIHVWTKIDYEIFQIVNSAVKNKENVLIMVVGEFGSGKTERLKIIGLSFQEIPSIYVKIDSEDVVSVVRRIVSSLENEMEGVPKIFKKRDRFSEKINRATFNLDETISIIERLTEKHRGLMLLLDELENILLVGSEDSETFIKFLSKILSLNRLIIAICACTPPAWEKMRTRDEISGLKLKILHIRGVSVEEALKIVENRIKRSRNPPGYSFGDPLYPFNEKAIRYVYNIVGGNPRAMIKTLRMILTTLSTDSKVHVIDEKVVSTIFKKEPSRPTMKLPHVTDEEAQIIGKIIEAFKEEEFSYISVAKRLAIPPEKAYNILESLRRRNILRKHKSKYKLIVEV